MKYVVHWAASEGNGSWRGQVATGGVVIATAHTRGLGLEWPPLEVVR